MKRLRRTTAWALAACAAVSLAVVGVPAAQADEPDRVDAVLSSNALDITWSPVVGGEAYVVVDERTGGVLWRGSEERFSVPVSATQSRSLLIFADLGDTSRLVGKVLAMFPGADSGLTPAVAVATGSGTTLRWQEVPDVSRWVVADSEGNMITTVSGTSVTLPAAIGRPQSRYTVAGDHVVNGTPTRTIHGFDLTTVGYSGADVGGDPAQGDVIAAGVYPIVTSRVPYETFIPDAYVNAPDSGTWLMNCESGDGSDYWYSGDNRGLAYESGKYRTRGVATYWWTERTTFTTKVVSPTTRYKKTPSGFVYDSQRTAPSDGFVIRPVTNDGRSALTQINHSVGNPYCSAANNIDYDIRQEMHQSGGHYFLGRHDQMPDHQLYRYDQRSDNSTSVALVFHHKLSSPTCLNFMNPFCPQRQYQYSK